VKIKEITDFLENLAPLVYQESYDNSGLLTGSKDWKVTKAIICIDCLEAIVDDAVKVKANLIIAHHPILFSPINKLTGGNYIERVLIKAIKHDIAIYAIHTNLDNVQNGVNKTICDKLGIKNCSVLHPKKGLLKKLFTFCPHGQADKVRKAIFRAGAGVIGDYNECSYNMEGYGTFKANESTDPYVGKKGVQHQEPETKIETIFPAHLEHQIIEALLLAHPYEEVAYDIITLDNTFKQIGSGMIGELSRPISETTFLKKIKKEMQVTSIRHTKLLKKDIKKVAVCGGSGSFLLKDALSQKADVFVTADFKYHEFFDAEDQILIADIGHYESEQYTMELLYDILTKNFSNFAVHLTKINTNPVNYF